MTLAVRRARPEDLPALVRLWTEMTESQAAKEPRLDVNPMAEMVARRWIEDHLPDERSAILVAELDGRIAGYVFGQILENPPVMLGQFYGYLSDLAVTASARRRGIGSRLAREIHEWFRAHRVPYVQLRVYVRNEEARAFWRKMGYSEFVEQLRMEL